MKLNAKPRNGGNAPAQSPAPDLTQRRLSRLEDRLAALLAARDRGLPVWIRSPKSGTEHFTGFSRAKLYALAGEGSIRSTSIREPGQVRGTRLFNRQSILAFIEPSEATAKGGGGFQFVCCHCGADNAPLAILNNGAVACNACAAEIEKEANP